MKKLLSLITAFAFSLSITPTVFACTVNDNSNQSQIIKSAYCDSNGRLIYMEVNSSSQLTIKDFWIRDMDSGKTIAIKSLDGNNQKLELSNPLTKNENIQLICNIDDSSVKIDTKNIVTDKLLINAEFLKYDNSKQFSIIKLSFSKPVLNLTENDFSVFNTKEQYPVTKFDITNNQLTIGKKLFNNENKIIISLDKDNSSAVVNVEGADTPLLTSAVVDKSGTSVQLTFSNINIPGITVDDFELKDSKNPEISIYKNSGFHNNQLTLTSILINTDNIVKINFKKDNSWSYIDVSNAPQPAISGHSVFEKDNQTIDVQLGKFWVVQPADFEIKDLNKNPINDDTGKHLRVKKVLIDENKIILSGPITKKLSSIPVILITCTDDYSSVQTITN